jgi:hypothetical protein
MAGEWEGDGGLDTAYSHAQKRVLGTPYREKCTLKSFGTESPLALSAKSEPA